MNLSNHICEVMYMSQQLKDLLDARDAAAKRVS